MPVQTEIPAPQRSLPRYCPERRFPPYRYVPGLHPHPRRDRGGHSYAVEETPAGNWDAADWASLGDWLWGVDLFNAFFFWEAHEAWEKLWVTAPRRSSPALLLQGLIQISASLLKIHLHSPTAARSLAAAGLEKVQSILNGAVLLGLEPRRLLTEFRTYFRPLDAATLPQLDASVPWLRLEREAICGAVP
jgi:hypothetical protein